MDHSRAFYFVTPDDILGPCSVGAEEQARTMGLYQYARELREAGFIYFITTELYQGSIFHDLEELE